MPKTIVMGSDHAGFLLKEALKNHCASENFTVMDVGCSNLESCDYPPYAAKVAEVVRQHQAEFGVLCCGSGVGMAIAANRYIGVRAVVCHDLFITTMCRQHNNANVICFGARVLAPEYAITLLDAFIETPFDGERHADRVQKIDVIGEIAPCLS